MKHKRLLTLFLALLLLASLTLPALAAPAPGAPAADAVTRTEQTEWYYRVYNGQLQKRLWSITYEKWLTNWMPV